MLNKSTISIFTALWTSVGIIHALLAVFSLDYFMLPFLIFSLLVNPIRSFLLGRVLNIQLEEWGEITANGALRGLAVAFCAAIVSFIILGFTSPFSGSLIAAMLVAFIAFRLTVIWWQYHKLDNLNRNWLYFNFASTGLYSLTLGTLLSSTLLTYPSILMILFGIVLSELAVSFAYINLRMDEEVGEKRKVEDM